MIRSKLPTAACWPGLGKKKRGNCEANLLYVESDFGTTDKSFTVFFAVEALNLIVESKSQPVELDNSTIGLHLPSRRKNSLQSYYSDFLALTRLDMTFDVTLRDDSSFGKLTNSCNFKKRLIFTFTGNV